MSKPRVIPYDRLSYLVQSSRDPDVFYVADLELGTCPCPWGEHLPDDVRSNCRHMKAAEAFHALQQTLSTLPACPRPTAAKRTAAKRTTRPLRLRRAQTLPAPK